LEALGETANAVILGTLLQGGVLNLNGIDAASRALAVGAARAKVLPLAIRGEATVASAVQDTLRMEACKLVKTNLVGRMLIAIDATTLAAVMAALEETEGLLAAGCRANRCGAIRLKRRVSTMGLDWRSRCIKKEMEAEARH
jgi:hypothetical protein